MKLLKRIIVLFMFILFAFAILILCIISVPTWLITGEDILNHNADYLLTRIIKFYTE